MFWIDDGGNIKIFMQYNIVLTSLKIVAVNINIEI